MASTDVIVNNLPYNDSPSTDDTVMIIRASDGMLTNVLLSALAAILGGDYAGLTNKPSINGVTLIGNKTAAQLYLGTYSKPSDGIPSSDMTTDVQSSLGKADAALPKAGGTMTGEIAMGSHKITGLAAGTANTDAVNKKQMEDAISALGEVLDFKGAVQTVADLPTTGNTGGDVYFVRSLGAMFVWVETGTGGAYEWDEMGEHYDMSGYLEAPASPSLGDEIIFDGNAWIAGSKILWVTYGTTTFLEISAAVTAGKIVVCLYSSHVYQLTVITSGQLQIAEFSTKMGAGVDGWLKCAGSTWTNGTVRTAPEEVTVSTAGDVTKALDAGKIYHFTGALTSLTLTLTAPTSGNLAQYHFDFDSGSTAPTVTVTGATWPGGSFTPEASKHYEVDILDGYAVVQSW